MPVVKHILSMLKTITGAGHVRDNQHNLELACFRDTRMLNSQSDPLFMHTVTTGYSNTKEVKPSKTNGRTSIHLDESSSLFLTFTVAGPSLDSKFLSSSIALPSKMLVYAPSLFSQYT